MTGDFTAGFLFFSVMVAVGLLSLVGIKQRWRTTWGAVSGARI